jgi:hypothetical protein
MHSPGHTDFETARSIKGTRHWDRDAVKSGAAAMTALGGA